MARRAKGGTTDRIPKTPLQKAEDSKRDHLAPRFRYGNNATDPADFVPCGIETYGRLGPSFSKFLADMARTAYPPRSKANGDTWDVQGQMALYTMRLRAQVQIGLMEALEEHLKWFRADNNVVAA